MKRILALLLTLVMVLPLLFACGVSELAVDEMKAETETVVAETTAEEETEIKQEGYLPQSQLERNVTRILIIGNSHSNDLFFQLARVFNAQGFDTRYTLGFLYYSGCSQYQHVHFCENNQAVYDYYESSEVNYVRTEQSTMQDALKDHEWDIVFFQCGHTDFQDETLAQKHRDRLMELVDQYLPTEHVFGWHASWPNPNDPDIWSNNWPVKPPAGHQQKMIDRYGLDPVRQFNHYIRLTEKNITPDPRYTYVFSTGSAILYANRVLGLSQKALYRDYTHLSDLGRVIAAYSFYAQLTGKPIEEVKLDKVPAKKRQSRYQSQGDLILTEDLKHTIKESANYSLENTWTVPGV
ncbi:MAG: DUF4886 domain-containing protein [Clostridia bacterium]|nr:DUF4886 domain-containing protein [Clostridia bacterium]